METAPDESERARAAVAVSCLRWLGCTGPAAVATGPNRHDPRAARRPPRADPPPPADPAPSPRPLWDPWLDG